MELEQARKRAEELRVVIEKNNRLYYDQDAPELEDFEYDALTRELKAIEAEYPELITSESPTQHVGGTASSKFSKVTHSVKMESLQDAFSLEELRDFDARIRDAGIEPEYVVEAKLMAFRSALSIATDCWCGGPPVAMVRWEKMLPKIWQRSRTFPGNCRTHRNFWKCAAKCICRMRRSSN